MQLDFQFDNLDTLLSVGSVAVSKREYDTALKAYSAAIMKLGFDPAAATMMSKVLYFRGRTYVSLGRLTLASKDFDDAIRSALKDDPLLNTYRDSRTVLLLKQRKYQEALDDANATIKAAPFYHLGYERKAKALQKLRRRVNRTEAHEQNAVIVSHLPVEIWESVFELCSLSDRCAIALTCQSWYTSASHLRFRAIRIDASSERSEEREKRDEEYFAWVLANPRVCLATRKILLEWFDTYAPGPAIKTLLQRLVNLDEICLSCEENMPAVRNAAFQETVLNNVAQIWTRLTIVGLHWAYKCDTSTCPGLHYVRFDVLDRTQPISVIKEPNRLVFKQMETMAWCVNAFDQANRELVPSTTNKKQIFKVSGEKLTCTLALLVLEFAHLDLEVLLTTSTKVCCDDAIGLRAQVAAMKTVTFHGGISKRPRAEYQDVARWEADIGNGVEESNEDDSDGEEEQESQSSGFMSDYFNSESGPMADGYLPPELFWSLANSWGIQKPDMTYIFPDDDEATNAEAVL